MPQLGESRATGSVQPRSNICGGQAELPDCVVDSELVVLDATGNAIWERARRRAVMRLGKTVMAAAAEEPAVLCGFDLLALGNDDLRSRPLREPKDRLHQLLSMHARFQ